MGRHSTPPPDIRGGAVAVAAALFAMTTGLAVAGHGSLLREGPTPTTTDDAAQRVSVRFEGCRPAAGCDHPVTARLVSRTTTDTTTRPRFAP